VWMHRANHEGEGSMTLEDWVERQERHIPHHIEQMKQNHEIWLQTHPPRKPASPSPRTGVPSRIASISAEI
jgi:hypothetical protein